MLKILTVVGARPQFIKASVVSAALRSRPGVEELLVHTGQHYDASLSTVFFEGLDLGEPDINLGIGGGSHANMTGKMMLELEGPCLSYQPDFVLVYGDTNSTLAASLVAAKLHIPIAHVEAGVRSGNMMMPEEINRIVTDSISTVLFCPSSTAYRRLQLEAQPFQQISNVGDVMFDLALNSARGIEIESGMLSALGLAGREYCLATIHRAENTDRPDKLTSISRALEAISAQMSVIFPLHPRTRQALQRCNLLDRLSACCTIIQPVDYISMVELEMHAQVVLTDSGGVQKEAYFHKVPCVTVRTETEWPELCELGWNKLVSPLNWQQIASTTIEAVGQSGLEAFPYGDGTAGDKIAMALSD